MNELKSCPFCGGEAVISVDPDAVEDTQGRRWAYNVPCALDVVRRQGLRIRPKKLKRHGTGGLKMTEYIKREALRGRSGDVCP